MTFPQNIDPIPSIDANKTLGQEQHTQLHLDTFDRIRLVQSYIGGPPSGGEPDIPAANATVRERLVHLEARAKNPSPVLKMAVNQLAATAAPTVGWNATTGTVTFGIPAGAPGAPGATGSPGTLVYSGSLAAADYPPGITRVPVSFPPAAFVNLPKVFGSSEQTTPGGDIEPLVVGTRNVTLVGCALIVNNTTPNTVRAVLNWMAL